MQNDWYDDSPMFPNQFERYRHDLQQIASSFDNYMDEAILLLEHREELERKAFQ